MDFQMSKGKVVSAGKAFFAAAYNMSKDVAERYTKHQMMILNMGEECKRFFANASEKLPKTLPHANFTGAYLATVDLENANLRNVKLDYADLRQAKLKGANLTGASLKGARLDNVDLTGAILMNADLTGADMSDTVLTEANLTSARLSGSKLETANFTDANLWNADFEKTGLTEEQLQTCSVYDGATLPSHLNNLEKKSLRTSYPPLSKPSYE